MWLHVSLSVSLSATCGNFTKLFVHDTWPWAILLLCRRCDTGCVSGFLYDVMSAQDRLGIGKAKKARAQSDSPEGNTGPREGSYVYDCFVGWYRRTSARHFSEAFRHRETRSRRRVASIGVYIGRQWRNFVPYLCQLVFAAILRVQLLEMFVTLRSLKYAFSGG